MDETKLATAGGHVRSGNIFYRVLSAIFGVCAGALLILMLLGDAGAALHYSFTWLLWAAVAGCLLTGLLYMLLRLFPALPGASEYVVVGLLLAAFLLLQLAAAGMFDAAPVAVVQKGEAYAYARDTLRGGGMPTMFLQRFPGEAALFYLYLGLFSLLKLVGVGNFTQVAAVVLNILLVSLAVFVVFLSVRRVFGKKMGLCLLLLCMAFPPLYTVHTLLSAEAMAFLFAACGLYLWLGLRSHWREGETKGAGIRFLLLSVLLGVGALFKAYLLVLWLAFALDWLLMLRGRRALWLLGSLGLLALFYIGGLLGLKAVSGGFAAGAEVPVPPTHWIMHGLAGNEGEGSGDLALTLAEGTFTGRLALNLRVAGQRIANMGAQEVFSHLAYRLRHSFGNVFFGTLDEPGGAWENNSVVKLLGFALYFACVFWAGLASFKVLHRKNGYLGHLRLLMLGVGCFVLLWPEGPGAVLVFLPAMLLMAAEAPPAPVSEALRKQQLQTYMQKQQDDQPGFDEEAVLSLAPPHTDDVK